jgi:hypothetical protein
MTSGVVTPKIRAVKMWPNSWSSTHRNSRIMKRSPLHAACGPPDT